LLALEITAGSTIGEISYRTPDIPVTGLEDVALANYENYHNLPKGSATLV